jgi:cellobiose-specific phosphotransferase system component IIC
MVFGKDTDPRTDERRERVNNFSNFKNQISMGLNMIVSVFAMFGMGYYICLKMSYSEKTSLIVGLVSAVVIMFIEMVLFIFRAVRVEDSLERKVDDGTYLSADVNVNETSGNGVVTTMRDNGIPSGLGVSSKKTDLVTKKNQ